MFFDLKMGLLGATGLAIIIYFINADHDPQGAVTAAIKQFTYTFLVGGFFTKMVENLSIKWEDKLLSIFLAVIIPALTTIALTYVMHRMKGTPEPLNSSIPTIMLAPISFSVWATMKRSEYERKLAEGFI